jgi:hypothetical protein
MKRFRFKRDKALGEQLIKEARLATFRRKIRLSRIEVIWNACWKEDTPPAIPAGCLAKSFVIFGVASLPISR